MKEHEDKKPVDMVVGFSPREATEEETRSRFPKDYAGEQLVPILEQIPLHHAVNLNVKRSFVLAAKSILLRKKPGMKFKVVTDTAGTWVYRAK